MFLALFLMSFVTGTVGTVAMLITLYLPALWNGLHYDTVGAIGSVVTKTVNERSRVLGAILLLIGGIAFANFYGFFVLMFENGTLEPSHYMLFANSQWSVNLFYPFVGAVGGLGHGVFMSLITTFIITDFHPVKEYRNMIPLIISFIVGHMVYGAVVLFYQSQFLQLMLN